jgi:ABC-type lipoprotein export system ATPase subunit
MVHNPQLIMADEPTGNLDSANAQRIMELFRDVHRRRNITIILITHSLTAAQTADRIIYMSDGRIDNV